MSVSETVKGVLGFLWRALDALRKVLHLVLLLLIFGVSPRRNSFLDSHRAAPCGAGSRHPGTPG